MYEKTEFGFMYIHEKVFLDGSEIGFETLSPPAGELQLLYGKSLTPQKIKRNLVMTLTRLGYKKRCTSVLSLEKWARYRGHPYLYT